MSIEEKYVKDLEKDTINSLEVDTLKVVFKAFKKFQENFEVFKYNTENLGKFLGFTEKTNIRIERIFGTYYIYIDTVNGEEMFLENEYLVKDSKGNFYIYNKEDFEKTFVNMEVKE
jgi:hypothetical protein